MAPERLGDVSIEGVHLFELTPHPDDRGRFQEAFKKSWVPDAPEMVQSSLSYSRAGVLRGLHFHKRQADYWTIARGACRVTLVDLRADSPTFRRIEQFEMSEDEPRGVFIPRLVAHGLYAIRDMTLCYLVTEEYDHTDPDEFGVAWDDPDLGIDWGGGEPVLSERDRSNPSLAEVLPTL
ncbi:MAG: dTDP-4-dehydrorhamnose 3,5-epimerase [Actinomycetota bacterium]